MAGTAKPNIEGLGIEGEIILNASYVNGHKDVIGVSNDISGLLDGATSSSYKYGTVLLRVNYGNYIDFSSDVKIRIWAISSKKYSDSGGSTPKDIIIKKFDGNSWIYYTTKSTKDDSTWYDLTGELESGRYRIEPIADYVNFDEWYIESVDMYKTFILHNGEYKKYIPKTYNHLLIEPKMTSNNSNGYKVSGTKEHSSFPLYNAFDGNDTTYCRTNDMNTATDTSIILELPIAKIVSKYSIVPYTNYQTSWVLSGFNDSGGWTVLNRATATSLTEASRVIDFENDRPYKIYKLQILGMSAGAYTYINEIKYYEKILSTEGRYDVIGSTLPTVDQFILDGMSDLSVLDRRPKTETIVMNNDTNSGTGEVLGDGKVFKKKIDLKKYFDITNLEIK